MLNVLRSLQADWMITKHTMIRWMVGLVPILYAVLMIWYFSRDVTQSYIYEVFYSAITSVIPVGIALLSALLAGLDEGAGAFFNLLSAPSRRSRYISRLILTALLTGVAILAATLILLAGMKLVLHVKPIQYSLFGQGVLLTFAASLIQIIFYQWLSIAFGLGTAMSLGGAGLLISAIVGGTSVGEGVWEMLPWAWPTRISLLPLTNSLQGDTLVHVFLLLGCGTAAALGLSLLWIRRWEGRTTFE